MSDRSEYWREYARTHREQRREIERRRDAKRRAARGPIVKTCVGCGVKFTPHHNGQKFCTAECRTKARKPLISNHEQRTTTEIKTDNSEVKVRIGVGFRVCKSCGKTFAKDIVNPKRTVCPKCRLHKRVGKGMEEIQKTAAQFSEMKRCEEIEEKKRRDRQRRRDAAWARWERENGVAPRFEYHGDQLVEIRGRIG